VTEPVGPSFSVQKSTLKVDFQVSIRTNNDFKNSSIKGENYRVFVTENILFFILYNRAQERVLYELLEMKISGHTVV